MPFLMSHRSPLQPRPLNHLLIRPLVSITATVVGRNRRPLRHSRSLLRFQGPFHHDPKRSTNRSYRILRAGMTRSVVSAMINCNPHCTLLSIQLYPSLSSSLHNLLITCVIVHLADFHYLANYSLLQSLSNRHHLLPFLAYSVKPESFSCWLGRRIKFHLCLVELDKTAALNGGKTMN